MDLVFATNNRHKLEEIKDVAGKKFNIISLEEAGILTDIPEDYETLEENAVQKAEFIFNKTGINCFADDTGLEVYTLDNQPGVYSARYSRQGDINYPGMEISEANIARLLSELKNKARREARFRTAIALIINGKSWLFEGIVEGRILTEPVGSSGFGYDPVFQPYGSSKSYAEMSLAEKNSNSHRAKAVKKLMKFLNKL